MTSVSAALSGEQQRVVWIAWLTYAMFYLGRLNISPALPAIAESLDIGLGEVGLLGTVFFWCYALGQFINGQLGNVLRPHWMIFTGLLVIAASNLLFALQTQLWVMAVFWGVNGFAQASGWGPMLRIISTYLDTEQRRRVSTLFSMSFQVGVAISWGLAGVLLLIGPWQVAFQVPAVLLILIAVLWRVTGLDADSDDAPAAGFSLSGL
ncbi:MAG: MFS transporter, partial [Chloroflexota bacterium]